MVQHFIILFCMLFFSMLFLNMKISTIICLLVYKMNESEKSARISLTIMTIAILFISLYLTLY